VLLYVVFALFCRVSCTFVWRVMFISICVSVCYLFDHVVVMLLFLIWLLCDATFLFSSSCSSWYFTLFDLRVSFGFSSCISVDLCLFRVRCFMLCYCSLVHYIVDLFCLIVIACYVRFVSVVFCLFPACATKQKTNITT
jgi:hypothetical protein